MLPVASAAERPRGDPALGQAEGLAKAEPPAPHGVGVMKTLPRDPGSARAGAGVRKGRGGGRVEVGSDSKRRRGHVGA